MGFFDRLNRDSSKEIQGKPREFIYIDDESVRGHLSSMGVGVETGLMREQRSAKEHEASGSAMLKLSELVALTGASFIPGGEIALRGTHESESGENREVRLNDVYRFNQLYRLIDESDIQIKSHQEDLAYQDIVEITGTLEPMSAFRFELGERPMVAIGEVFETFLEVAGGEGSNSDDDGLSGVREFVEKGDYKGNDGMIEASKVFTDNRVPLRVEVNGEHFGAILKRDMRTIPYSKSLTTDREYTVFGRVGEIIGEDDEWEPLDELRLSSYYNEGDQAREFRQSFMDIAEGHGVKFDREHTVLTGPTKIIHPIAIYW